MTDRTPSISKEAYVDPAATITGRVTVEAGASIWPSAVLRAEFKGIVIGRNTSIQDNCTVHTDEHYGTTIGENVTVGHNAMIHGATVEDACIIGIGSIILDGAVIGRGSIVGAGAVVTPRTEIPPNSLVVGIPGKVIKTGDFEKGILENAKEYSKIMEMYMNDEIGRHG